MSLTSEKLPWTATSGASAVWPCSPLVSPHIVTAPCLVCISYECPVLTLGSYSVPLSKLLNLIKIMTTTFKNCFVDLKKVVNVNCLVWCK